LHHLHSNVIVTTIYMKNPNWTTTILNIVHACSCKGIIN